MRWVSFFVLAYVALGLDAGLARAVEFHGAVPNFALLAVVYLSLNAPHDAALLSCFILGAMHDLTSQPALGLLAFSYGLVATLVVGVQQAVSRRHPVTHFALALAGGIVTATVLAVHGWLRPPAAGVHAPVGPLFSSAVYSALLAPLLLAGLQRINRVFRFQRRLHA